MLFSSVIKEFKLLLRDLHGLAVLFVMPILFVLIMSAALSDSQENPLRDAKIVLAGSADSRLDENLFAALEGEGLNVRFVETHRLSAFQAALQRGETDLLLFNPNSEETPLDKERPLRLWLSPDTDRARLLAIKGMVEKHYTAERLNLYLDGSEVKLKGKSPLVREVEKEAKRQLDDKFAGINAYLEREAWQETYLNHGGKEVVRPNSVQHSVPAWLIFGMFFIMIPLSNVMAMERQTNTITRLRMARVPAGKLIAAKLIPYFLINQLQFAGMLALGRWVLPKLGMPALQLSGCLGVYAVLAAAVSLAALGYGLLVSVVARSTEHAVVLGGGGIIIMAALGGIMVPTYVMPDIMQTVAQFSPMGWALSGFQTLLLRQAGLEQILPVLGRLAAFGLLTLTAAAAVYRGQLKKQVRF